MRTIREELIGWAEYCFGFATRSIGSDDWQRAWEMRDSVDENTRTHADCILWYMRFRGWGTNQKSCRPRVAS